MIIQDFNTLDQFITKAKKAGDTHLTFKCESKEVTTVITNASNAWSVIRSMQTQYKRSEIDVSSWNATGWIQKMTPDQRKTLTEMANIINHEGRIR